MIEFMCPFCRDIIILEDYYAGGQFSCSCGVSNTVPDRTPSTKPEIPKPLIAEDAQGPQGRCQYCNCERVPLDGGGGSYCPECLL